MKICQRIVTINIVKIRTQLLITNILYVRTLVIKCNNNVWPDIFLMHNTTQDYKLP